MPESLQTRHRLFMDCMLFSSCGQSPPLSSPLVPSLSSLTDARCHVAVLSWAGSNVIVCSLFPSLQCPVSTAPPSRVTWSGRPRRARQRGGLRA